MATEISGYLCDQCAWESYIAQYTSGLHIYKKRHFTESIDDYLNEGVPFLQALCLNDWEVSYGSTMLLIKAASVLRGRSSSL